MTIEDWRQIRRHILEKDGAKNPATKRFLELNGLILSSSEIPNADSLRELNPKN